VHPGGAEDRAENRVRAAVPVLSTWRVYLEPAARDRAYRLNFMIEPSDNAIAEDCPSSSTVAPGSSYPLRRLRRASRRGAISGLESRPGSRAAAASTINADEALPVGYCACWLVVVL
jgi:hypothetical protein